MTTSTLIPIDSSKSMPTRRRMSMSCGWVLMPAPRPVRSSALRSNTVTSQPTSRRRCAASNPPSEPPIISTRRMLSALALGRLALGRRRLERARHERDQLMDDGLGVGGIAGAVGEGGDAVRSGCGVVDGAEQEVEAPAHVGPGEVRQARAQLVDEGGAGL